jgi:MoaA/NifB/PqqE/SkfB family radical SAM enzyme
MDFPGSVSFTITNACNLRCRMCGQWSERGYMHERAESRTSPPLGLGDWKRLVDEIAQHGLTGVLLRGGEPFLFPGIVELLDHIAGKGIFISIDTNGTLLGKYADDLVRIGKVHVTVSIDGPAEIHDAVRGVPGAFAKIRENVAELREAEKSRGQAISKGITFTISPYSVRGLGALPEIARSLAIQTVCIVPYYYLPKSAGLAYERELRDELGCDAYSWRGFEHESSGVDFETFRQQHRRFLAGLRGLTSFPYLPLTDEEYRVWFSDPVAPVRRSDCPNIERLIDIQPNGDANFCVDFPDYVIGNAREATIAEMWNGEQARRFREYRRRKPLAVCHRCGAKYMALIGA